MELDHDMENLAQTQVDTRMAKAKPVKLGWNEEEIEKIVSALNELLANYAVHHQKLRNYHWNVKGADFFDLHRQFEKQYKEAQKNMDKIAERIRVFGKTPFSMMKEFLENAEIKETGSDLDSEIMVREILNDYYVLIEYMATVVDVAIDQEDAGTEEMVKGFIQNVEKHHWMFSAFLAK